MTRIVGAEATDTTTRPIPEDPSDARLVERVRQGDVDAFGVLVNRYEGKARRVARRFIRDHQVAEDLTQEAFMRAYRRLGDFDASRRFGPWLMQIVVNLALDELRRWKRRGRKVDTPLDLDVADDADDAVRQTEREELRQQIRDVVDQLSLKYRTVLVLRDLEGLSCSEVAAIVRRPEATVRWRLSRARDMFRRRWEQQVGQNQS